jgi:hypothetical protein
MKNLAHLSVPLPSVGVSSGRALEGKTGARAGRQPAHARGKAEPLVCDALPCPCSCRLRAALHARRTHPTPRGGGRRWRGKQNADLLSWDTGGSYSSALLSLTSFAPAAVNSLIGTDACVQHPRSSFSLSRLCPTSAPFLSGLGDHIHFISPLPSLVRGSGQLHPGFLCIPSPPSTPFPNYVIARSRRRGAQDLGAARTHTPSRAPVSALGADGPDGVALVGAKSAWLSGTPAWLFS